ncbi:complex I subunit 5 family protein [Egicoccus halophilus]|uniref:Cation:proton antiporter n=1 Tax=Egicoccus halophilus TaxID=1670830 RepID=A0A8J3A721_9ACTN|nr:proton-conducting transporter membrane subunit [Egicoccus halophilus]GGI05246.1 cation:proton antiporter [Egicoccus halophilus]
MSPQASLLPLAAVGVPVLTAVAILVTRRLPAVRDALLVVGAVATLAVVAPLVPAVLAGEVPTTSLGQLVPGVELSLRADGMGLLFALLAAFLWVLAGSYAIGYMRGDAARNQTRFYAFYALCLSTAFGVAFAGDLFTFFIFYELLTIATYPLVTHKGDDKAIAAGRLYLGILLSGGVLVLAAILLTWANVGELAFTPGGLVGDTMGDGLTILVFALFAAGFATKSGMMPVHRWLPAAMVAPTPVSALLHAVAVVKAGVFAFGRVVGFVIGPDVLLGLGVQGWLSVVAGVTIAVASVVALRQDHLKRRLAYSTIAHLSFIVLGFSLLSPTAFEGGLLHIVNHGLLKITLFFCAGAIHIAAHKDHVSELDGIGRRMPFTMLAFGLASYGLAALPPMGGFVSKWYLTLGALDADQQVYAALIAGSGLFTAGYLFPVVYRAFFKPLSDEARAHPHGEASPLMVVPLCVTAVTGLLLGLGDLGGVYSIAADVAAAVTGGAP